MRTIYGPVDSWRFGHSLGIDPLASREKQCPFSCIYCQYGKTNRPTVRRQPFVTAQRLQADLHALGDVSPDCITFAGLGEPTLASNLPALVSTVRERFAQPVILLTGSGLMPRTDVWRDLAVFDTVVAKLDAPDEWLFRQINRPGHNYPYTLAAIIEGMRRFRQVYTGRWVLQMMFVRANRQAAPAMAELARTLDPDEIQLNTPLQPALGSPLSEKEIEIVEKAFAGVAPAVHSVYRNGQARIRQWTI